MSYLSQSQIKQAVLYYFKNNPKEPIRLEIVLEYLTNGKPRQWELREV